MIKTRVNFELSKERYKELKSMCVELDISVKELMTSLIDDALNKYKKKISKTKEAEEPPIVDLKFKPRMRKIPSIKKN